MAAAVDVVTLVLFVVIGRGAHHHGETLGGFLSTVWPFAAGTAAGWLSTRGRRPLSPVTGLSVCVATVAVGMVLRVVAGQGTAAAFVGVAVGFTGLCMVGGRLVARRIVVGRRDPRRLVAADAEP